MTEGDTLSRARPRRLLCAIRRGTDRLPAAEDEASLAVGHELGRRALQRPDEHARHHREPLAAGPGAQARRHDTAAALAVPAADAGGARRGHARIPRRHKALRTAARPRRGSRRPRRVPQRAGEFAAGGLLRRRSHRGDRRDQRRVRRHHRLRRRRSSVPPPYPWVADDTGANARLSCARAGRQRRPPRRRSGTATDTFDGWRSASTPSRRGGSDRTTPTSEPSATSPPTRAAAERERAVARLATAVSVARSVDEVLSTTLDAVPRSTLDAQRLIAVMWPTGRGRPDGPHGRRPGGVEMA